MGPRIRLFIAVVCIAAGIGLCIVSFTARNAEIAWYSRSGLFLVILGGILLRKAMRSPPANVGMDWYEVTSRYHQRTLAHDAELSSLPEVWQRELAALWRLEADVNNGAYLQFLTNWRRENY